MEQSPTFARDSSCPGDLLDSARIKWFPLEGTSSVCGNDDGYKIGPWISQQIGKEKWVT